MATATRRRNPGGARLRGTALGDGAARRRAVAPPGARDAVVTPAEREDEPGHAVVFTERFPTADGRATLVPANRARPGAAGCGLPLVISTGRVLEHWHTGAMTRHANVLDALAPVPTVSIHPDDALRLGVKHGETIRVESRHGAIEGVAELTRAVKPGHLFLPASPTGRRQPTGSPARRSTPSAKFPVSKSRRCALSPCPPNVKGRERPSGGAYSPDVRKSLRDQRAAVPAQPRPELLFRQPGPPRKRPERPAPRPRRADRLRRRQRRDRRRQDDAGAHAAPELDPSKLVVGQVLTTQLDDAELMRAVAMAFGIPRQAGHGRGSIETGLQAFLLAFQGGPARAADRRRGAEPRAQLLPLAGAPGEGATRRRAFRSGLPGRPARAARHRRLRRSGRAAPAHRRAMPPRAAGAERDRPYIRHRLERWAGRTCRASSRAPSGDPSLDGRHPAPHQPAVQPADAVALPQRDDQHRRDGGGRHRRDLRAEIGDTSPLHPTCRVAPLPVLDEVVPWSRRSRPRRRRRRRPASRSRSNLRETLEKGVPVKARGKTEEEGQRSRRRRSPAAVDVELDVGIELVSDEQRPSMPALRSAGESRPCCCAWWAGRASTSRRRR